MAPCVTDIPGQPEAGGYFMLHPSFSLKDLSAGDARMALSVARFTREELGVPLSGETLLIALSGGADSTALLVIFCALRAKYDISLFAAHLDHGLRAESAEEAEAAGALCRELGVPFFSRREDVGQLSQAWRCGVEEAGRRARYAFLEQCRRKVGARWILTAHHAGDLAEDVLMRLARGAAWPGLGGMEAVVEEEGRRVLRPLLMLEKKELSGMLERLGVSWREDASNASLAWKRNRVRHEIMPLFLAENPRFHESVRRIWRCAQRDRRAWKERLASLSEESDDGILLADGVLKGLDGADRMRCMAEAVERLGGEARADTLERVEAAWLRRLFPRRFSFGGGVKAELSGRGLLFYRAPGR